MKRNIHIVGQLAAIFGQFLVPVFIPQHAEKAHAVIGFIQAVMGVVAHAYNPDGTPAEVAYDPKS